MRIIFLAFLSFISISVLAQEDISYQKPSPEILALADYERAPNVLIDDRNEYMVMLYRNTYKTLDDLSQDEIKLGGLRVNPNTSMSSTMNFITNMKIRKVKDVQAQPIQVSGLPKNCKIAYLAWSPDEHKIAFTNTISTGNELWVLDLASATATRICEARLNACINSPFSWHPNGTQLLVRLRPENPSNLLDPNKEIPSGPIVSITIGKASQNRTFTDLLKNKLDEQNFENIITSELFLINLQGEKKLLKDKNLFIFSSFSPDGNYLLYSIVEKPFSYLVPYSRFPIKTFVLDTKSNSTKMVNDLPLTEIMPKGFSAVRKGKRSMNWRNDKPASLSFVVALDEGDPAIKVSFRDELFSWDAPFTSEPYSICKTENRFEDVTWGNNQLALVSDSWYDTRMTQCYAINPSNRDIAPRIFFKRNYQDVYSDPGNFETRKNNLNKDVLAIEKNNLYLIGDGFTDKGQFPFIDKLDITSLKTTRIYTSSLKDKKESILRMLDYQNPSMLVMIESKNEFPNYYIKQLEKKKISQQITFNGNPFQSIANAYKKVIKYQRADGVALSGTLYLPVGYDTNKKEKLPLLIWAYPEEFIDKQSAGQNKQNSNEFTFPNYGSFVYYITQGYAVLDDASFPIIGEGTKEPNDNFIEQLVSNAQSAIHAIDQLGYVDTKKVAVGGHSYGAFMTANLLTHSNLFACGIARSGAYNRTLTPFGFQSEQRNYWDVPSVYNEMSPFYTASKMKIPILLVHGEADNNPGTFTLQTERYFQALKGLGANARMLILPKESHSYVAKENIMHLLWEQEQFLKKHLK